MGESVNIVGQAAVGALRGDDHDRGLQRVVAVVCGLEQVGGIALRVSVLLPESADAELWMRPNAAFRVHLDNGFDGASRIYTVRDYVPATRTMVFDVIVHGFTSPMMQWAGAVREGDALHITGPRPHLLLPATQGRPVALFLDATAVPALHAMLLQWPEGVVGSCCIACDDAAYAAALPWVPGLAWRCIAPGAPDSQPLLEQARALASAEQHVIWAAGERSEMRALRQHFCGAVGLPRQDVAIAGYWKLGQSNTEVDQRRREAYEQLLARGGTLLDFDDLAVET